MTQPWKNNACLVDGHGNFGSMDGDGAAAMRYTEARLSEIGQLMLDDINEKIVPYRDNFDATEKEPVYLPTKYPQLFVNGCEGVAVGMKTEIPPHNLGEMIDGTINLIKNPKLTTKELMKFIKGPDYPTGGVIINKNELLEMYETGMGKVVIRGRVETEDLGYGRTNIVITEIPYTISSNKTKLLEGIIDMMKNGKLNEVADARDESAEDVRIVLEVKKGQDVEKLLNKLYKKTKLQENETCNFLAVNKLKPITYNLKEYLTTFIEFQEEITTNKYELLLDKAKSRLEVVEGLLLANDLVDPIIETIRFAKNIATAKKCLITGDTTNIEYKLKKNQTLASKFSFTEKQAQVILEMRLSKLNNLEINSFEKEKRDLLKNIANYEKILKSKTLLDKEIIKYLTEIKEKFATPRKTSIINLNVADIVVEEDAPIEEDVQILIDRFGYIKVCDLNSVARSSEETLNTYKHIITAKNTDKLAIFTDSGNVYQIKLLDMPRLKMKDKGQPLDVLCGFKSNTENILLMCPMNEITKGKVIFVFDDGYVKKVQGNEYITRQKQTVATKLYNNKLVSVLYNNLESKLIVETNKKKRNLELSDKEDHKKNVKGNKWFKLTPNEFIQNASLKEV